MFIKIKLLEVPVSVIYKKIHYYNWLFLSEVTSNLNAFWKFYCAFKYFYKNTLQEVPGFVIYSNLS